MSGSLNPAQKAWETRRKNGTANPANPAPIATARDKDIELVMIIHMGESQGYAHIDCGFTFIRKGKGIDLSALSKDDMALISIHLVATTTTTDSNAELSGYDHTQISISDGTVSDLESILPKMRSLDSMLQTAMLDADDTKFAMALQAIAWNLRVDHIEYDGKRTKRGIAYTIGETLTESVLSLYQDKPKSA